MTIVPGAPDLTQRIDAFLAAVATLDDDAEVWRRQFDAGLAWVHFPVGEGGLDGTAADHGYTRSRLREAGIPDPFLENPLGHGMAAPTLVAHGSQALQDRLLRRLFCNDDLWCQLFSEPDAGSDLAGLATAASPVDGGWRVRGQKVWTSLAHRASWGLLLARTDPDVPKHRGLTYFVADMTAPGVTVRPLRQLTGDAEFNEVFLDDVFVPDEQRLGAIGDGWRVAMTTLANERSTLGDGEALGGGVRAIDEVIAVARRRGTDDPLDRDRLASLWARAEAIDALAAISMRTDQGLGAESSIAKLATAELNVAAWDLAMDVLGEDAFRFPGYDGVVPGEDGRPDPRWSFLRSRANTIEGGTSEVMLNILGERVLGLPPDVRVDRDVPWRSIPRSR